MQTAELKTFIEYAAAAVDRELDRLIPGEDFEPQKLHKAIRHSVFAGGKRFRPALVLAVGNAFGAEETKLITTAAAVEMIHTYSLIHDDLPAMDDDDLRRGRPTCHRVYGEATAILAGDVLQTLAFQAISLDSELTAETRVRLISELALGAGTPTGMVAGQQSDLEGEGKNLAIEELELIHQKKTAAIIVTAARAGALIAEAEESMVAAVSRYASLLGLLFQITDDLLDVTQATAILGKTAGKDESVKKATYPAHYGIDKARSLAEDVHKDVCAELEHFEKPKLLKAIADFVLVRDR